MTDRARDGLVVGRGIPNWVFRAAILLLGAAIVAPLLSGATLGALVVLAPAVLAAVYAPDSPAPAAVVIAAALLVALSGTDPLRPEVLVLIPLVHLFHVTCALAGVLPYDGRLHVRALRAPALRFVVVQAAVFALAGLAALLPTGRVPAPVELVALVGLTALALLIVWLQRRR